MTKKAVRFLFALALIVAMVFAVQAGLTETPLPAPIPQLPVPATVPPQDPLMPDDISAWTYTPEFAERFRKLKLKEPGPTGAYAVNFQVQQIEELDRCVLNVFLDNQLPIDYPEGPVGFLSFTYPMSWAFLKLSPADQQAVDAAYFSKYRERRAMLLHGAGEEPLPFFQYRNSLYPGVAVITLAVDCARVPALRSPLRIQLRTTTDGFHEVGLPEHWLGWVLSISQTWRRPTAKLDPTNLADPNVWSYTPEFAKRFGLSSSNDPPPIGAQAVAFRVERYHKDEKACILDVYIDDATPLVYPEAESGFAGPHARLHYFLLPPKDKTDRVNWYSSYSVHGNTELFTIRELKTEREQKAHPFRQRLNGSTFRVGLQSPFVFEQYRRHVLPGLSYIAFSIGCFEPPSPHKGSVGAAIVKTDGTKHEIGLPMPFMDRAFVKWRELVNIPFRCKYPKLYPREHCENRVN